MLLRRSVVIALLLGLVAPTAARAAASATSVCTDKSSEVHTLGADRFGATGRYALPSGEPVGLVVFFHGYGHTADDWAANHLAAIAERDQVIALAMDYPGTDKDHTWQVKEGAEVSNRAARWFVAKCDPPTVVAYGVSMGGNASGMALASSRGLYDYWFDIEGANNVIETYNEARALAPANAFAAEAQRGIELEMGGSFEEVPQAYFDHTNVYLADKIAASGISGVVMVHAVDDGLVPYDQSREMQAAMRNQGTPVQFWTVLSAGRSNDTTIDGYADGSLIDAGPLAGHSNENNGDSRVAWVGFDRLDALFASPPVAPTTSNDYVYDEDSGQYTKP